MLVRPKPGILDPQGEAVGSSLRQLGFAVDEARVGRVVDLELDGGDADAARAEVERMCEQLLANPLIESYEIELDAMTASARAAHRRRRLPGLERRPRRGAARSSALGAEPTLVWHAEPELPEVSARRPPRRLLVRRLPPLRGDRPLLAGDGARCVEFAADGGLVLGICNGFQILCEAGLLPGVLRPNASLAFVCRDVALRVERADTPFTSRAEPGRG